MSLFTGATPAAPVEKDLEVVDPPPDSISCLAFSPVADFLAVGSWDNNVRIYEVGPSGQTQGKAMYAHEAPVLDLCWSKDGARLFSAGADKVARAYDLATGQSSQVASHDAPVRCCRWVDAPSGGYLVTGSWDKTVKYWDTRSPTPIGSVTLPDRCYSLDVAYPLMVVGMAERHIAIFNLQNPGTIHKTTMSPLKWQTRCIACFPAANGYAIGSVEGRVAIQYIDEKDNASNFSFKCHRKDSPQTKATQIFSVNSISFHQGFGTFATAGSEGGIHFWDKDQRTRLKSFEPAPGPITTTAFNRTGTIFAYAISYDWSKGHSGMVVGVPNKVMLHPCKEDEVRKKKK